MKNITTRQFSVLGDCGCWKGFDHEETEGPWAHQYEQNEYQHQVAPHATTELAVIIADEQGEYACYTGMCWVSQNKLAYMEPLCTIPEYRNRGLAAAALSEMYRKTKKLGATHMTGGFNEFYKKSDISPRRNGRIGRKDKLTGMNGSPMQ